MCTIGCGGNSRCETRTSSSDVTSDCDWKCSRADADGANGARGPKNKSSKYVHVPHREKPPQVVAKRNARERRRVQAVNNAFAKLRKALPLEQNNRGKRVSKVKTLQYAIEYIHCLQEILKEDEFYCRNVQVHYFFNEDGLQNFDVSDGHFLI